MPCLHCTTSYPESWEILTVVVGAGDALEEGLVLIIMLFSELAVPSVWRPKVETPDVPAEMVCTLVSLLHTTSKTTPYSSSVPKTTCP